MSKTVDERVVSMKFDNKQFESNVQTSLSTLDKLKQSLNLTGAAKGFEQVQNAAKSINFSGLSGAVDTVKDRFSALEVMAVTALANITNSAVNAGRQMLHSLTVEPIKQGFEEYELKLDSVQTIMASTGESLETVNGYLQELNTYADKTIYSFSDMTSSIGKFTNSGVKLEDAVKAIQGISNEAAVSGANAQQASHAMYNFAQALSSGSVKLIDWKSIENANMATVEFKNELIKTAVELGTVVKEGEKFVSTTTDANDNVSEAFTATSMFNDSLSSNWMTSEVLVKTLAKYSDETSELGKKAFAAAQDVKNFTQLMDTLKEAVGSGWATTWEIIFGDFEQAKTLWTAVSKVVGGFIDSQSDARNSLLQEWKDLGGRTALIEAFKNAFNGLKEITVPVQQAFTDIIPPITGKRLTEISKKLKTLTSNFKIGHELTRNWTDIFKDIFRTLMNIFGEIQKVVGIAADAFKEIFPITDMTGKRFREIASEIRVLTEKFKLSDTASRNLKNTFKGLFAVLDIIKEVIWALVKNITPLFGHTSKLTERILHITGVLGECLVAVDEAVHRSDIFNKTLRRIGNAIKNVSDIFRTFIGYLKEKLYIPGIDEIKESLSKILDIADKSIKAPGLNLVNKVLEEIGKKLSAVKRIINNVATTVGNAFSSLKKKLSEMSLSTSLRKLWDIFKQIMKGIGSLIGKLIKKLGDIKLQKVLAFINDFALGGMGISIFKFFKSLSKPIKDIGDGISEIASFPQKLTEIFNRIKGAFGNISGMLNEVKSNLQAYQTQLKAGTLMKIALAVGILTASIVALTLVDENKLSDALVALTLMFGDLMTSMAIFTKISGKMGDTQKASIAMVAMSFSLLILASAMKKIAELSWEDIAKGLSAFVVMLYFMSESMSKMTGNKGLVKSAFSLILVSVALNKVAKALQKVGEMEWEVIAKGLSGLVVALYFIVESINKIDGGLFNDKKFISIGISLILIGEALKIVAKSLKIMSSMSWEEIARGLSALAISLYMITELMNRMGNDKQFISIGIGLILVAESLKIIAKAIKSMGSMSWEEIARGLSALAISLYMITELINRMPDSGKLMGVGIGLIIVSAALNILAKALKKMGSMDWDEVGKSLLVLASAMAVLTISLNLMKGTLAGSVALLVAVIALQSLSKVLKTLGNMSVGEIVKSLVAIAGAFAIIGVAGLLLKPLIPTILALSISIGILGIGMIGIGAGLILIGAGLQSLSLGILGLGTSVIGVMVEIPAALVAIVKGIIDILPSVVQKVGEIIVGFCDMLIKGVPKIKDALVVIFITIIEGIMECIDPLIECVAKVIMSVLEALVKYAPAAIDNLLHLVVIFIDGLVERIPEMMDSVIKLIIGIIDSIAIRLPELVKSIVNVIVVLFASVFDALQNVDPEILEKALYGIGIVGLIMAELTAIALLTPKALIGVLGMGTVISELALVLAAIGGLAQIPGLTWIVEEGGNFLAAVGTAVGKFFGGLIGGAAEGLFNSLPNIGTDLSDFMKNVQPFVYGAKNIDAGTMDGVKSLVDIILALTGANILDALTSWFTGDSISLADFGKSLAEFGPHFKKYCNSIGKIDGEAVVASANAAKAMSEMASNLPRHDGVVGWFLGDNGTLSDFADELVDFAPSLMIYAKTVEGLDTDVVTNSINAAKVISEFSGNLPKHGGMTSWFEGDNSLKDFAKELALFGPNLMLYSLSVKGLNPEVVTNSISAARVIAEFEANLPKHGGFNELFTGSNKLSDFAEELPSFGYNLHLYSLEIDEIKPSVVTASANAAKSLAELAVLIPHQGGLSGLFNGEQSLEKFGKQLPEFGKGISAYADEVKDLKPEVVTSSVNAADALVALSNNLDKQGGVISFFTGDKNLKTFGENLKSFGESFASYSEKIGDVDVDTVTSTTNAAQAVVALQREFAEIDTGGGWFSNSATLTDFGTDMKSFGESFKNYYDKIKDIKPDTLNKLVAQINNVIDMSKTMNELDVRGMKDFGAAMKELADMGIKDFIKSFTDSKSKIETTTITFLDYFLDTVRTNKGAFKEIFVSMAGDAVSGIEEKYSSFEGSGKTVVDKLISGMLSKNNDVVKTGGSLMTGLLNKFGVYTSQFISSGQSLMDKFANGISNTKTSVQNDVVTVVMFAITGIKSKYNDFYSTGVYLINGFVLGIQSNANKINTAATEMANTAATASAKALDEHSPSRVGYQIGSFFGMGFVNAIADYENKSYLAGENVAYSAQNGLNAAVAKIADTVNGDMEIQPTIRPVVDLSEVRKSTDTIGNMFNAQRSVDLVGKTSIGIHAANANIQNEVRTNNDNIIREMTNLRKDISQLSDTVGRMRVVMDTGALVGAIAVPVNNALGRQLIYEKRGN